MTARWKRFVGVVVIEQREASCFDRFTEQAMEILTSPKLVESLDFEREYP